jgi:D-alanyl-D-alanine dipeptidase
MTEIVLIADPRVAALPVIDCGEPLVDLAERADSITVDDRLSDPQGDWRHVRSGLAARLVHAARLLPDGIRLVHLEGYRSPERQAAYFANYLAELTRLHPDLDDDRRHQLASRYIAPPSNAPHSAGAAVDVTLADSDGVELDMGTRYDATPEQSDGACYTDAETIGTQARANRAVLIDVLTRAGFVNYPTEWWHWSYGDRYWAWTTGRPRARYAAIARPSASC